MLQTANVPISFSGGLDTKTDEKLVLPGKLTLLENGVFNKAKKIGLRNGYTASGRNILGSDESLSSGQALEVFGSELIQFSGNRLYSYSEVNDGWIDKGVAYSVDIARKTIVRNSAQQSVPDLAVNQGVMVYAWEDSRGGVRATVVEESTGAQFISDFELSATGEAPKCVSIAGFIFVLYADSGNLRARRLNPLAPTSFESAILIGNDLNATTQLFDIVPHGLKAILVYHTASEIKVAYFTQDGAVGSITIGLPNAITIAEDVENSLCVTTYPATGDIAVFYHNTADGLRYCVLRNDFTELLAPTEADPTIATDIVRVTAIFTSASEIVAFYEFDAAATYNHLVKTVTVETDGDVGSITVLKRSVGLASKAFQVADAVYVNVAHDSTLQATCFTLDTAGLVVAKFLAGRAGGLPAKNVLPNVVALTETKVCFPAQIKTKFVSEGNTTFTLRGVADLSIDFDSSNKFQCKKLGENLHISGGLLSIYDGAGVVESGFHLFPENITATPATSGGDMADGTYNYFVVYEWVDNRGQVHKSAPSIALPATVAGGGGSGKVTLSIPTLRITAKSGTRTNVVLSVYRTVASGTIAYKVTSVASPTYNSVSSDTVSYEDTQADEDIDSNEILYTTGGVIENIAPPACADLDVYQNRMALISSENPLEIAYSKSKFAGEGVAFSDLFIFSVDPLGGDCKAVKMMDDKIIIFKENLIFYVSGDGPNDTGAQNNYSIPQLVTSDVGCPYPKSVVLTPRGIMFKSTKGIYLLDRGLQLDYVGDEVEDFNSQDVTSAELLEDSNQVRFLTSDGSTLVYDYFEDQWSTFTNHEGVSATVWNGAYSYLRSDGKVYRETADHFQDDNVEFRLRIGTAWVKVAGVQGYQRVRRAAILGEYKSSHTLRMKIGYDYESSFSDTVLFNAGSVLEQNYYGEDSYYGESEVYGGVTDSIYQFRAHLRRQKCQSIRFLFENVTAGTPGEGYSLSDLSLEIGVKKGLAKLRSAKSVG